MRNYFPNHGAEDSTYTPWSGNILFGAAQAALSAESSTENPRTGNRSVRVEWPAPDGSGKPRVASASFGHEGIRGNWRVGGWVYVPSGSPDVAFGSVWQGLIVQNVTAKDQWVQVEVMIGSDSQIGNASWLKVETINASPNAGVVYLDDVYAYPGEGNNPEVEPDLKVEISWDGLPFDENPTWDDITDYVQAVNPSYGRSSEIGSVEAGTCELVLDNEDGRFTPKRAASPYFPNIRPRRPVRVTAEWDGAIWPLFRGHVDRWPASTASGYTNVSVALVDIFGVLSKKTLENIYVHYLRNNSLRELYAFNDGPDSFAATVDPTKAARVVTPSGSTVAEGTLGDSPSVSANGTDILPNGAGTGAVSVSGVAYNAGGSTDTQLTGRMIEFPTMEFDNTASSLGWTISFWHAFDGLPAMGGDENVGQCMALRLENSSGGLIATILYNAHPTGKGYTVYWPEGGSIDLHYDPAADLATHYMGQGNHVVLSFSNDCRHDGSNVPGLALFVNGAGSYREIPASAWIGVKHSARMLFGANPSVKPEAIGSNTIMAHNFRLEMLSVHDRDTDWWNNALMMERASGNPGQSAHDLSLIHI